MLLETLRGKTTEIGKKFKSIGKSSTTGDQQSVVGSYRVRTLFPDRGYQIRTLNLDAPKQGESKETSV